MIQTASHKVARNTIILYMRMAITVFVSLYTTRVVLSSLGEADFGALSLVFSVVTMFSFLANSAQATTQRFASVAEGLDDDKLRDKTFNSGLILSFGVALITVAVSFLLALVFFELVFRLPEERVASVWSVYSVAVLSSAMLFATSPYESVLYARERMFPIAAFAVIDSILKLLSALVISNWEGDKLVAFAILSFVSSAFVLVLRGAYCRVNFSECRFDPLGKFDRALFFQMLRFGSWSSLGGSSSMLASYGQVPVLNAYFGVTANAAHAIASQVNGQLGALSNTMLRALGASLMRIEGGGDRQRMLAASCSGTKLGFFLLALCCVPIMLEAEYIFRIWLKQVPKLAVLFCQILLLRSMIEQLFITLATSILATGEIARYQTFTAVSAPLPIVIAVIAFRTGADASAMPLAFLLYAVMAWVGTVWFAKGIGLSVRNYMQDVLLRCLATLFIALLASSFPIYLMVPSLSRVSIVLTISTFVFAFAAWRVGFTPSERTVVLALFRSFSNQLRSSQVSEERK